MSSVNATIDYTSKDYDGLKSSLLAFAEQVIPEWKSRSEGDFGVALVELLAYEGDILSYYGDRIQDEAFLATATRRESLLQIASMLGYLPSNGVSAQGTVTLQTANPGPAVEVPPGTQLVTDFIAELDDRLVFETDDYVTVPANGGTAVVAVTQGQTRTNVNVGASTGLPGQRFRIPERRVLIESVRVFVDASTDINGTITEEWNRVDHLVDAGTNSKVFSVAVDANGEAHVAFGDGSDGLIPNVGLNIAVTYRVSNGAAGNVSAGSVFATASPDLMGVFVAVDNNGTAISSEMGGGADPESNDQIRANAPRVFRTQNRLVTLTDYADAALAVPGVTRANAVAGSFSSVSVYVVGPGGSLPSQDLLTDAQRALNAKVMAGVTITMGTPAFVPVNVGSLGLPIVVQCYDNYRRPVIKSKVETAIRSLLAMPNTDFGARITVSDFYATIMSVPGVRYTTIPLIARADAAQSGTADIVCRDWEIPKVGNLFVTVNGGLN